MGQAGNGNPEHGSSDTQVPSIAICCLWFGPWPKWFDFTLESMKANRSIDWIIITGNAPPAKHCPNVRFQQISIQSYLSFVTSRLGVEPTINNNNNDVCKLKAALGHIHEDELNGYDFFGFSDLDIIFGNIRRFYTPALLSKHQMLTTHNDLVAGHFTVMRNTPQLRTAFMKIPNWRKLMQKPGASVNIEEWHLARVFGVLPRQPAWRSWLYRRRNTYIRGALFEERYSTILTPMKWHDGRLDHPESWFWKDGRLSNDRHPKREYLYLHFMNWKSDQWLRYAGLTPPCAWSTLDRLVHIDKGEEANGFRISPAGFTAL